MPEQLAPLPPRFWIGACCVFAAIVAIGAFFAPTAQLTTSTTAANGGAAFRPDFEAKATVFLRVADKLAADAADDLSLPYYRKALSDLGGHFRQMPVAKSGEEKRLFAFIVKSKEFLEEDGLFAVDRRSLLYDTISRANEPKHKYSASDAVKDFEEQAKARRAAQEATSKQYKEEKKMFDDVFIEHRKLIAAELDRLSRQ